MIKEPLLFTAPQFTPDQLQEERQGLSEEERAACDADVEGTAVPLRSPLGDAVTEQMRAQLNEIPESEKLDYLRALELCPRVVASESAHEAFLRATSAHPQEAALRLVAYWKHRCRIFQERAFEPLDRVLNDEEAAALRSQVFRIGTRDRFGRPLFFLNMKALPLTPNRGLIKVVC